MSVEQLSSPEEHARFAQFQQDVLRTAAHHNVGTDNSILIGTGAFAVHGLNAHVPELSDHADVDIINIPNVPIIPPVQGIVPRIVRGVRTISRRPDMLDEVKTVNTPGGLPLQRISGRMADSFARNSFKYPSYDSMVENSVTIPGTNLRTLPVDRLVHSKLRELQDAKYGKAKHEVGLFKAHVFGHATGHEIINDPYWRRAIKFIMLRTVTHPAPPVGERPKWLTELIRNDFDHPAFKDIPRESRS